MQTTSLDHGAGTGSSKVTNSITPVANALIVVAVFQYKAATPTPVTPTISGYTQIATFAPGSDRRITLFRSLSASPSPGALTIDFGGASQDAIRYAITQFLGVKTTGTNGADAVIQSGTFLNTTTSIGGSVTLSPFVNTSNVGFGLVAAEGGIPGLTAGSNFTQLTDADSEMQTEYARNENIVNWTWNSTAATLMAMAIEVAAAPIGGNFIPFL